MPLVHTKGGIIVTGDFATQSIIEIDRKKGLVSGCYQLNKQNATAPF